MENIDFLSEMEALGVYPFEVAHHCETHITEVEAMLLGKKSVSESVASYIKSVRRFFDEQLKVAFMIYESHVNQSSEPFKIVTYLTYNEFKLSGAFKKFPNERSHRIWATQFRQKIKESGGWATIEAA